MFECKFHETEVNTNTVGNGTARLYIIFSGLHFFFSMKRSDGTRQNILNNGISPIRNKQNCIFRFNRPSSGVKNKLYYCLFLSPEVGLLSRNVYLCLSVFLGLQSPHLFMCSWMLRLL